MPRAATADSEKKKGVDGFGCSRRVVAGTAPAQAMARKKPAAVNPGKHRPGDPAELAHRQEKNPRPCKLPAEAGMMFSGKTEVTLPVPPPGGAR